MELSASGSLAERAGKRYLKARGHADGCIVIAGYEGERREVALRAGLGAARLRAAGGLPLGRSTLIAGTAGSGKTVFASHFLAAGVRAAEPEPSVFVTFGR